MDFSELVIYQAPKSQFQYCCELLSIAVKNDVIIRYDDIFCITGKGNLVNDGNGHYDYMADETEILFCPFCGKKLEYKIQ